MKYSRLQLKRMAKHLQAIKERDSDGYFQFIIQLTLRSGKDIIYINTKINNYIKGNIS